MWTWVWWKLRVPLTALAAAVQEAAPDGETLQEGCRHPPLMSPRMSNAAQWAISASVKFREVARTTENPTTKLLAEGLTHLTDAVRELDQQVGHVEDTIKSLRDK
jgi:hypothetical protein